MQKLLSVAVPCFNSQDYMRRAIESLLPGGDKLEIIVVDDGSTDDTSKIAGEYEKRYPDIVRLIRKDNGGHGDAVMTGIDHASGLYFRVLDSDDWIEKDSLIKLMDVLEDMTDPAAAADLVITNYIYDKVNEGRRHKVHYRKTLPSGRLFGWDEVGKWATGSYLLMHSSTYRTEIVRSCGMDLPKNTYYVDHLYVCYPMPLVEKMYYLDTDLYHYFIGREGQSVNEKIMLGRMDQVLKVNRHLLYEPDVDSITEKAQREYIYYYTEIVTQATVSLLLRSRNKEDEQVMQSFLDEIMEKRPAFYDWIMQRPFYRHYIGPIRRLPHWFGYPLYRCCYLLARRIYRFN